jgi:membrane protease YdiL (CAAX protease family)
MPWDFVLIFLALAVLVPWRGWTRLHRLLALPAISSKDRISLYLTSIATQWLVTALVAWRALSRGLSLAALGWKFRPSLDLLVVGILGAGLIGLAHWLNLRRISRSSNPAADRLKELAAKIFPHSGREAAIFCGLAVTAGICEEFLYRGFAFAALRQVSFPSWAVLAISSVLFGLAHAYQGRGGILGTLILGTVFGSVRILYDSLVPVILWHAIIDVVAGLAGRRYLIENKRVTVDSS